MMWKLKFVSLTIMWNFKFAVFILFICASYVIFRNICLENLFLQTIIYS